MFCFARCNSVLWPSSVNSMLTYWQFISRQNVDFPKKKDLSHDKWPRVLCDQQTRVYSGFLAHFPNKRGNEVPNANIVNGFLEVHMQVHMEMWGTKEKKKLWLQEILKSVYNDVGINGMANVTSVISKKIYCIKISKLWKLLWLYIF